MGPRKLLLPSMRGDGENRVVLESQSIGDMPEFPVEKAEAQQYFQRLNGLKSHVDKWDHWHHLRGRPQSPR